MRHGHFDRPDGHASAHSMLPLSATGRGQAEAAAAGLLETCTRLGLALDRRIETSQLLRAYQTAVLIGEALCRETGHSFEIEQRDELIERGLGSCANLSLAEIERTLAADPRLDPLPEDWRRRPDFRLPVPGAESLLEAGTRTARRIEASLAELDAATDDSEPSDRVRLFVAHAGCLRLAAAVLGALDLERAAALTLGHAEIVLLERLPDGRWQQIAGDWSERPDDSDAPPPRAAATSAR